jgi:hypothetical protein
MHNLLGRLANDADPSFSDVSTPVRQVSSA